MKTEKQLLREELAAGMSVFLGQGKEITKLKTKQSAKHKPRKQAEEETVEIEIDYLPEALKAKYFAE